MSGMNSKLRLLSFTSIPHMILHGLVLSLPLFIPIWQTEYTVTLTELGFAMALQLVFYGGMAIPAGILSDRYGSHNFITLCLVIVGLGCLLMASMGGYASIWVGLIIIGVGAGLYHAPALSLLSRQPFSSSRIFAYHAVGGNVGIGLGPLSITILLTYFSWRIIFLFFSVLFLLIGMAFVRFGPRDDGPEDTLKDDRPKDALKDDTLGLTGELKRLLVAGFVFVIVVYILRGAVHRGALTFFPDFLNHASNLSPIFVSGKAIPPSRWVYSAILFVGILGQLLGGYLGDRFSLTAVLGGLLVGITAILLVIGTLSGWPLIIVSGLFGMLTFAFAPLLQSLVAEFSSEESRGLGYGLTSSSNIAVGGFIGTYFTGWLATNVTYAFAFRILAVFPVVALVVILGFSAKQ